MKATYVYIVLTALIIGGLILLRNNSGTTENTTSSLYDTFAQCLNDAGAKFYGAYWCPHCQAQKKLFQNSKNLPYIECSTPNGQGQLPLCTEAGITGYPTWTFTDGSLLNGEQTLETLATKTNCALPSL